jgi:hypothetical protein
LLTRTSQRQHRSPSAARGVERPRKGRAPASSSSCAAAVLRSGNASDRRLFSQAPSNQVRGVTPPLALLFFVPFLPPPTVLLMSFLLSPPTLLQKRRMAPSLRNGRGGVRSCSSTTRPTNVRCGAFTKKSPGLGVQVPLPRRTYKIFSAMQRSLRIVYDRVRDETCAHAHTHNHVHPRFCFRLRFFYRLRFHFRFGLRFYFRFGSCYHFRFGLSLSHPSAGK